jgi:flagellar hook assembly protein FlgD
MTDIQTDKPQIPERFEIAQNYPNPFNPSTTFSYSIPTNSHVTIEIFNILGQRVRTLIDEPRAAGVYEISWDGDDSDGRGVSSGVYLYRFRAGDFAETRKMLLLK